MCKVHKRSHHAAAGGCGGFYFVGFLGALVYFVNAASGFWPVVLAFFQAIVWPAYVVYYALQALIK
ncbi:hypothetical protein HGB25_00710 [Candidatus Saccharibacteria bacterium]|nr:hypothetical protein [Candidatus Saccharibacteria bacterium]